MGQPKKELLPITQLRNRLVAWGESNYQSYPWRDIENPWLALLAEVLLQRTNATHVSNYFDEMCRMFPTPESVLSAGTDDLDQIEKKFGLDRRMKTVIALAEYIESKDIFPVGFSELIAVYGIGHYTASAYLSLHMNVRAVLIDSNISRWLARLTGSEKPVDVRRCYWLWELAEDLTPERGFKDYNYAVLDFTMMVCKPRTPVCEVCPIVTSCRFHHRVSS